MKRILLSLALCAFSVSTMAAEEEMTAVEGMEKEIFVQAFPVESKEGLAKVYLYSKRELDLVWLSVGERYKLAVSVPVTGGGMFAYRFPEDVQADKITALNVQAWDVPSLRRIKATFEIKSGESALKYEPSYYAYVTQRDPSHSAVLVETAPASGHFYVHIVSLQNLEYVLAWNGETWAKAYAFPRTNKIQFVYRLAHQVSKKANVNVDIKGKLKADLTGFTSKFVLRSAPEAVAFYRHSHTALTSQMVAREEADRDAQHTGEELEVVRLMIQATGRHMRPCPILRAAAMNNSILQAQQGASGHPGNSGYPEIAFYGPGDPQGAVSGWQASPGHWSIMSGGYSKVGVAKSGSNSWTAVFSN